MNNEVQQKLIAIIVDRLDVDKERVVSTASFINDLGADSLDLVELIMELEEAFDIVIPESDAQKITTVQNVLDYIEKM